MSNIFERMGLIQENEILLNVPASEFEKILNYNLDSPKFRFFEVFAKSQNKYKGSVDKNSFTIQKKRRLFQLRSGLIKVTGIYKEDDQKTIISIEVNGWNIHMTLLYLIFILFYVFGYSIIFQSIEDFGTRNSVYFAIALTLHMCLQVSAPILAKKRSVRNTANSLSNVFQDMIVQYRYDTKFNLI